MPKKTTKKPVKRTTKKIVKKRAVKRTPKVSAQSVTYNKFFGSLLIAVGVGALIVFLRYLVVTWVSPADVYLVEPAQLIPGEVLNR